MLPVVQRVFTMRKTATLKIPRVAPAPVRPLAKIPASGGLSGILGGVSRRVVPEAPTSSAPLARRYRAIENALTQPRKPDRGSSTLPGGVKLLMPDGSAGGVPKTPEPLLKNLFDLFSSVRERGENPQNRQTSIKIIQQRSYTDRQNNRKIVASVGPGEFGALDIAIARRSKPGTPTNVQGDRALMNPQQRRAFVYASRVSPAVAFNMAVASRIGGAGAAQAPVARPATQAPTPAVSVQSAMGRTVQWAPSSIEAGFEPPKTGLASTIERFGLLIAVGVLGFMMLRGR